MAILRKHCAPNSRSAVAAFWAAACAILATGLPAAFAAGDDPQIVRVEEDWELVVMEPDSGTQSPQITCVCSPVGNVDGVYFALAINHQTLPEYRAGGMQVQLWNGGQALASSPFPHNDLLSHPGEVIRWTQKLQVAGDTLTFEVVNGTSDTWGQFGGQGYLKTSVATTLGNLNGYSPAVSAAKSAIGYAANRVTSLTLKKVRAFTSTGDALEDNTPRVVYQHD